MPRPAVRRNRIAFGSAVHLIKKPTQPSAEILAKIKRISEEEADANLREILQICRVLEAYPEIITEMCDMYHSVRSGLQDWTPAPDDRTQSRIDHMRSKEASQAQRRLISILVGLDAYPETIARVYEIYTPSH